MKAFLAGAAAVIALSAGFVAWLAVDRPEPVAFVPYVEPAQPPEASHLRAAYDPLHFQPAIATATDAQCLACHREVLEDRVREASPAGVRATTMRAWYQQTATYSGEQDTFHRRHLVTPLARRLMNLRCNTCHEGHDPRAEAPGSAADSMPPERARVTLRKQVDPEAICLRCHGQFPAELMGLPGPWEAHRAAFGNTCLTCHAAIRTNRHEVNYLNAAAIEQAGREDADACYGCHGGRAWYRTRFAYARTPWPGMPAEVPDWARARPRQSEARFLDTLATGGRP